MALQYSYRKFWLLLLTIHPAIAWSQSTIQDYHTDFTQKEITAFSFLNVEDEQINRPTKPQELALQLSTLALGNNDKPQFAVELNPQKLFWNPEFKSLHDYRTSHCLRGLSINFAHEKGEGLNQWAFGFNWVLIDRTDVLHSPELEDSIATRLDKGSLRAAAIQSAFRNERDRIVSTMPGNKKIKDTLERISKLATHSNVHLSDSKLDNSALDEAVKSYIAQIKGALNEESSFTAQTSCQLEAVIKEWLMTYNQYLGRLKQAEEKYQHRLQVRGESIISQWQCENWNQWMWQVSAGAHSEYQPESTRENSFDLPDILSLQSFSAITSFAAPLSFLDAEPNLFGKSRRLSGQLVGQFSYSYGSELSQNGLNSSIYNKTTAGGRVLYGHCNAKIFAEYLYFNKQFTDPNFSDEQFSRIAGGFEIKLLPDTWLEIASGVRKDSGGNWEFLLGTGFKYAFNKKSRFSAMCCN